MPYSRLSMKALTAMLCLFAIVFNTALAAGGISYCIDKSGDKGFSFVCVDEVVDECCPYEYDEGTAAAKQLDDCDVCIDGRVEGSEYDQATAKIDRLTVKSPPAIAWTPSDHALVTRFVPLRDAPPASHAPQIAPTASREFTDTVQFRC